MTKDTQIHHVTPSDANLFAELGFSPAEAAQLQTQSQQQMNDTRALKAQEFSGVAVNPTETWASPKG